MYTRHRRQEICPSKGRVVVIPKAERKAERKEGREGGKKGGKEKHTLNCSPERKAI